MEKTLKYKLSVFVFIFPALFIFSVIVAYPVFQSIARSFTSWNGISAPEFIGIGNFIRLFNSDLFYLTNMNSLIFAFVLVMFQLGVGLLLALLLVSYKSKATGFFRFCYFLPVVVSATVICQLWVALYNYDFGLINKLFEALGLNYRQAWLLQTNTAIYAVAFVNAWHYLGIQFIMIYTAIRGIPEELYEAARIDGATTKQTHWKITIPLLQENFRFCLIMAVTSGIRAFDTMFIMTGGGPGTATNTLTYIMYNSAFISNRFGYGSAIATVIVLECLLFTFLINRFVAREQVTF